MIRRMQFTDLDKVSQIWLESNKEAHGFIPAEYTGLFRRNTGNLIYSL